MLHESSQYSFVERYAYSMDIGTGVPIPLYNVELRCLKVDYLGEYNNEFQC